MIALAELAEIRGGYPLRGKVKTGAEGDICLLQSKDLLAGSGNAGLMRANIPALPAHHFLQTGDLVLLARGARSPARVIADPAPRTICIAPLMHIRILDATILLPQYLAWLINLEETQQTLREKARNGAGQLASIAALQALPVLRPDTQRQQRIIDINLLSTQIRAMESELHRMKMRYAENAMLQFASAQ